MSSVDGITIEQFNNYRELTNTRDEVKEKTPRIIDIIGTTIVGSAATAFMGSAHESGYIVGGLGTGYVLFEMFRKRRKNIREYNQIEAQIMEFEKNIPNYQIE